MRPEDRDAAHLWDILQAAHSIQRFISKSDLRDYQKDEMLQAAVELKFEIIGEATRRLSKAFRTAHPEIPWKAMVAQRNVMAHDYGEIKPERVWGVAKNNVPTLIKTLGPLLPPIPPQLDLGGPAAQERGAVYGTKRKAKTLHHPRRKK